MCVPKYLTIAQLLPNSCLTFPAEIRPLYECSVVVCKDERFAVGKYQKPSDDQSRQESISELFIDRFAAINRGKTQIRDPTNKGNQSNVILLLTIMLLQSG